ncbi:MAG: hypothetical protein BWZ10_03388 [candidate division BRC1 bacterium ADurb.BinA364]|nr:MAG: hypothetical protein BWZ10_03388 [candidate division BRC1 bacterium ADurb.BinA364]
MFSNQCIHHIDQAVFALGTPKKVRCDIWTQTHDIEAEDLGTAVWLYENGAAFTIQATSSYPQKTWFYQFEITGDQGAYFEASGGPFAAPMAKWFRDGAWSDEAPLRASVEWANSADNMAAAIRSGAPLLCDGEEGRRSRLTLDAMYRSAREAGGGWVDVE